MTMLSVTRHKWRGESSPLGQSCSGSGLGNQSSLHELITRYLTDMLHERRGRGGGGEGRGGKEEVTTETIHFRCSYARLCIEEVTQNRDHL